jgi:uncharacterized membrane protein (UPF0182 family)
MQGNLLVIPIEEALIYVRPLYIRSESGKIPELKRVVVAYENQIAMEETLEAALAKIFRGSIPETQEMAGNAPAAAPQPAAVESTPPTGAANLMRDASDAYNRAIQAQRQGDWARYGEELKRLGAILENLNRSSGPAAPKK